MNNKITHIKRSIYQYFTCITLIALIAGAVSRVNLNSTEIIDYVNMTLLVFATLVLARMLIYRNYINIFPDRIIVHYNMFTSKEVFLKEISALKMSDGFLSKSYLKLKDGRKIKFDSFGFSSQDIEIMKKIVECDSQNKSEISAK